VFWYLDETFIGSTKDIHEIAILPKQGKHIITVVDKLGNEAKRGFEVSE
jgi:penicillin-binding protein 1C